MPGMAVTRGWRRTRRAARSWRRLGGTRTGSAAAVRCRRRRCRTRRGGSPWRRRPHRRTSRAVGGGPSRPWRLAAPGGQREAGGAGGLDTGRRRAVGAEVGARRGPGGGHDLVATPGAAAAGVVDPRVPAALPGDVAVGAVGGTAALAGGTARAGRADRSRGGPWRCCRRGSLAGELGGFGGDDGVDVGGGRLEGGRDAGFDLGGSDLVD